MTAPLLDTFTAAADAAELAALHELCRLPVDCSDAALLRVVAGRLLRLADQVEEFAR